MEWHNVLFSLPGILLGLTVHECAHAWMAFTLGDPTARDAGRLSFNPLRHLDPLGTLLLLFAGFGWAKPVMFNPANLSRPRRDRALIAAAGPCSNLLLAAFLMFLLMKVAALAGTGPVAVFIAAHEAAADVTVKLLFTGALVNLGLFIFNLIPLPPLDGSHILFCGLNPPPWLETALTRFGGIALVVIIIAERQTGETILPIGPFIRAIVHFVFPQMGAI
jgi:Zn-dependent protease